MVRAKINLQCGESASPLRIQYYILRKNGSSVLYGKRAWRR